MADSKEQSDRDLAAGPKTPGDTAGVERRKLQHAIDKCAADRAAAAASTSNGLPKE